MSGALLYQHRVSKSALQVSSMPETPIAIYFAYKIFAAWPLAHTIHVENICSQSFGNSCIKAAMKPV